jgi:hypothetical protein
MQNRIPKKFFRNLCRTEYRKKFSVNYAETINRKTFYNLNRLRPNYSFISDPCYPLRPSILTKYDK